MSDKQIIATVNGRKISCAAGIRLGDLLSSAGPFTAPCGGHGRCGKCRVKVTGEVSPPAENEIRLLSSDELAAGIRLACCTVALGDCSVTAEETGGAAHIQGEGELPPIVLDPAFSRYGAAVDIGTTTLAARLYAPDGLLLAADTRLNPESRWGADVISRMEACLAGHAREIAVAIRETLSAIFADLSSAAGIDPREIDGAVITGNTVMLHLLTETDVEPLTHAPFHAARLFGETVPASELGLTTLGAGTPVYLPPCSAAFVGADITTALLCSGIADRDECAVLVDIGTNGEMVLKSGGKLYATSTAAGPAFEGAGISMGMGGKEGAIDRVKVEEEDGEARLKAHVIGGVDPVGICGSGLVDAVACLLETETLDESGYLEDDPAVILDPVCLTQQDIRMVQLAKSAIHAGMRTLLKTAGVSPSSVLRLCVAGGFGSYLDIKNAGAIGLLPEELLPRVRVIGNAALGGASMLLLSKGLRAECESRTKEIEQVELASNPVFAAEYMERMLF